ncbi:hypothetical protein M1146_06275 [Patescibacteria group bacterium]|nr:hypothetical protein [Patescibacteria group bacterium]
MVTSDASMLISVTCPGFDPEVREDDIQGKLNSSDQLYSPCSDVLYDEGCWFLQATFPEFVVRPNGEVGPDSQPLRSVPKEGELCVRLSHETKDVYVLPFGEFKIEASNLMKVHSKQHFSISHIIFS